MSDDESEKYFGGLGNPRNTSSPTSSDCDEDEVDTLNSSTATAGPPGSRRTGRYQCPNWDTGSSMSGSSPSSSTQQGYERGGAAGQTGNFHVTSDKRYLNGKRRSLSSASNTVSLIGSAQEWSRSFCLFNPGRPNVASRASLQYNQMLFSGKHFVPVNGVSSPLSATHGTAAAAAQDGEAHRPSVSFSMSFNHGIGGPHGDSAVCRSTSTLFLPGQISPSVSTSPLSGAHRTGRHSFLMGAMNNQTTASFYAMGGTARHLGKGAHPLTSPARKELNMLLPILCSHLSLLGTPIITGNVGRTMDLRKGPLIGSGGFAKVYAGMDCVSGKLVAIKEINIAEIKDEKALRAIGKEFGILKLLRHPNIVSYQLFEHSASQKVCRIVMELLTGGSSLVLLGKYGPLREPILRKFTRHILQAIQYIHKEGISHQDIKPANILVSDKGVVKLCDFGCSKRVNELSKSTSCVLGTPLYMAPEFIKGEATHKSDIWSMGCSLFQLATNLLPWHHAHVRGNLQLMFYITSTSETPLAHFPSEYALEFSPEFKDFLEQCFIRDVKKRPEARDLLKHPWIKGSRLNPTHNSPSTPVLGELGSPTWPWVANTIEEEILCQHELEDVSARISIEMCHAWMIGCCASDISFPQLPVPIQQENPQQQQQQQQQQQALLTDLRYRNDDLMLLQQSLERHMDSQPGASSSQCQSPAVSARGGGSWVPMSPTVSLDATQHDNFNYSVPLGASEGCFVIPPYSSSPASSAAPQYLRINAYGNLEFVPVDDDFVEVDAEVDDALASSFRQVTNRSPSTTFPLRSSSPTNDNATSQTTTGQPHHRSYSSQNNNISHGGFSLRRSPGSRTNRQVTGVYNQSVSLMSISSFASRGVSPSRHSQTASTASLTTSQQLPSLLMMAGSVSLPVGGTSMNHSSDDISAEAQVCGTSGSNICRIPENVPVEADGRLHMSLSVPTGASERCVNIELSIDPGDVQCKYVERRPSYVVAFTEDVKSQIAAKMSELASSTVSSPTDSQLTDRGRSNESRSVSRWSCVS